jgi:lipooligosaccharide transport system permease protein
VFGLQPLADLYHVAVLVGFAGLMWLLATHYMTKRLID